MVRIGWIFSWLYLFSACAYLAATLGDPLFNDQHPTDATAILFLLFGFGALFLALQLVKAFTEDPPAWYVALLPSQSPDTTKRRTFLIAFYTSMYVAMMAMLIGKFPPEQIAIPMGIGLLAFLLLTSLLQVLAVICSIRKMANKFPISGTGNNRAVVGFTQTSFRFPLREPQLRTSCHQ